MADLQTIRKRLEKYILDSNHTFREVSLKIGRKDSYIQQYVKYGFPKRLNEVDRKKVCQLLNISEKELIDDELLQSGAALPPLFENDDLTGSAADFVAIDICAARPGTELRDNVVGRMVLNFAEFGSWCAGNPFSLRFIRLDGDYMEPTLPNGSLVMFDSGVCDYSGDGIYVIETGGDVQIKRLQKTAADTYALKVDSPRYQDLYHKKNNVKILGRAVFCLSGRPL